MSRKPLLSPGLRERLRRAVERAVELEEKARAILRGEAAPESVGVQAWDFYKEAHDLLEGAEDDVRELRIPSLARAFLRVIDYGETRLTLEGRENWETLARELVTAADLVKGKDAIAKSRRNRAARADSARRSAKKARENRANVPRKQTLYEKRLAFYEETVLKARLTRASKVKLRQSAAEFLRCRVSYVNKLLKRRDERSTTQVSTDS